MKAIAVFGGSGGLGGAGARYVGKTRPVLVAYKSNAAVAEKVVADVVAQGGTAKAARVDTRDLASVEAFLEQATDLGGGLGGVISATGAQFPMSRLVDANPAEFWGCMEEEVLGTFNILKASAPRLEKEGGGPIVIFLTTAIFRVMKFDGINAVPKAAMEMMIRHVALENGPQNVRVNAICPGVIDAGRTDLLDDLPPIIQEVTNNCMNNTPLKRRGRPVEVGALCSYLISDEAEFVNGQIIGLDGGWGL